MTEVPGRLCCGCTLALVQPPTAARLVECIGSVMIGALRFASGYRGHRGTTASLGHHREEYIVCRQGANPSRRQRSSVFVFDFVGA